jgi:hypothetical protein
MGGEPEGSVLWSQEPTTGPYHNPDEPGPHPKSLFLKYYFHVIIVSSYLTLKYQENGTEMIAPCITVRNVMGKALCSPVTVAMQSKVCSVFYYSNSGIVCLNLTQDTDVFLCPFCVCVICVCRGQLPAQGVLSNENKQDDRNLWIGRYSASLVCGGIREEEDG